MERAEHGRDGRRAILYRGELTGPLLTSDALSPHFNFGRGFFETILYEGGELRLMDAHRMRMESTCRHFSMNLDYSQMDEDKILSLLERENLADKTARVKILYAPVADAARWDIVVTTAPYTRPANDFVLSVHGEIRDISLCRYKSLNYQYNLYWKEYFYHKDRSDEVLFLNRYGNVLEGSYTNVLYTRDSVLHYAGLDQNYLQGIMQGEILKNAQASGKKIQADEKGIPLDALTRADEVFLCNSLLGKKNVRKIIL